MEALRPASILPAIKCSTCGAEIEISSMGEHVCAPSQEDATEPEPTPLHDSKDLDQYTAPPPGLSSIGSPRDTNGTLFGDMIAKIEMKPPRTAPPRIDPAAANKPYMQRDMLTPSPNDSFAPKTPLTPHGASRPPPARSMTSPMPRIHRPPSPQMSSNLDCAFPPFPTSRSVSNPKPKSTHMTMRGAGSNMYGASLHAEPESYTGPRSPRTSGGAQVMQRMNTIAPGPFDARRRGSSQETGIPRRSPTPLSAKASPQTAPKEELGDSEKRPGSSSSNSRRPQSPLQQSPLQQSPPSTATVVPPTNKQGKPVPQRPMRPEPLDDFLDMLKNGPATPLAFPVAPGKTTESETLSPSSSQADQQDSVQLRRPSEPGPLTSRPSLTGPSLSAPSSLPNASELADRALSELRETVPPLPPLSTIQAHSHQNTVHAPSDSASSTSSTRSFGGSSSKFDTSTPVSATSSVSMLSASLADISRDQDPSLVVPSLQVKNKPVQSRLRTDGPIVVTPDSPQEVSPLQQLKPTPLSNVTRHPDIPESPIISRSPISREEPPLPTLAPLGPPPLQIPGGLDASLGKNTSNRPSSRRAGTTTKHHCRGCREVIVGKSVKAADGRLTGRYHKQCFVCKTCQSPFATADFYVINNDPYCEQHYHQLNNSLCAKCDRGIEGPYLETQQGQKKFHLDCFTCIDCRRVLNDDYFEISGAVYCEQHAFTALRREKGLGPKRNMERRTTRLMMMGPGGH